MFVKKYCWDFYIIRKHAILNVSNMKGEKIMSYPDLASLWASYNSKDLRNFFESDFFKNYVKSNDFKTAYEMRLKLSDDMAELGLIPLTALEDAFSEERELQELQTFAKLYDGKQ